MYDWLMKINGIQQSISNSVRIPLTVFLKNCKEVRCIGNYQCTYPDLTTFHLERQNKKQLLRYPNRTSLVQGLYFLIQKLSKSHLIIVGYLNREELDTLRKINSDTWLIPYEHYHKLSYHNQAVVCNISNWLLPCYADYTLTTETTPLQLPLCPLIDTQTIKLSHMNASFLAKLSEYNLDCIVPYQHCYLENVYELPRKFKSVLKYQQYCLTVLGQLLEEGLQY